MNSAAPRAVPLATRILLPLALAATVFAYLPTLGGNFVAPDHQWRAFRYGELPGTASGRLAACADVVHRFYIRTVRPLVWRSECLEHAAVATIADFAPLRWGAPPLVRVLVAVDGRVLAPAAGGRGPAAAATEVATSQEGLAALRQGLWRWIATGAILPARQTVVVRPAHARRAATETDAFPALRWYGENATYSSTQHPEHLFHQMARALRRERHDHLPGHEMELVDCGDSAACLAHTGRIPRKVALTSEQPSGPAAPRREGAFVVDLSRIGGAPGR